tara:strand:+ start:2709 stop:4364 length:1656 start_codon:yes stop_codon:yes gene_type:complete
MLCLAIFELFSVGLLLPILNSLFNDSLFDLYINQNFFELNFLQDKRNFELFLFVLLLLAYFFKFLFYIFFSYLQNTYLLNVHYKTSRLIYKKYLDADYYFHIKNNVSTLIKNLKDEVEIFIFGVLMQSAIFILEIFVLVIFTIFLLWYNFQITLLIMSTMLFVISIYILFIRKKLKKIGKNRFFFEQNYLQIIVESLTSIKDIKLLSLENAFFNNLSKNLKKFNLAQRNFHVFQTFPKQIIELVAIFVFIIILIFSKINEYSLNNIIVTIGIFGASAIRIMPMFVRLVSCYQQISFHHKTIDTIYAELNSSIREGNLTKKKTIKNKIKNFDKISFENVTFRYPNSKNHIFKDLNLQINKGDKIGIFGDSGIGKSTLVDLLTGLVFPSKGVIKINGYNINERIIDLRRLVSYSQQNTCILNESILKNIILNKPKDLQLLKKVSKITQLKNFVSTNSNFKLSTGEKGKKISGGQKQRLSLARSIYRQPELLILDESTNAMDSNTEKAFFDELLINYPKITLIIISHNKKVLKRCKKIYEIKNKKISLYKRSRI